MAAKPLRFRSEARERILRGATLTEAPERKEQPKEAGFPGA